MNNFYNNIRVPIIKY